MKNHVEREPQRLGNALGKDGNPDLTGGTIEGTPPDVRVSANNQIRAAVGDFRSEEEFYLVRQMLNDNVWVSDIIQVVEDMRRSDG